MWSTSAAALDDYQILVFTISLQMCICDASEYIFVKVTRSYFLRLPMPSWSCRSGRAPYLRWIPTKQLPSTHLTSTCSNTCSSSTWPEHTSSNAGTVHMSACPSHFWSTGSHTWPAHALTVDQHILQGCLTSTCSSHLTSTCFIQEPRVLCQNMLQCSMLLRNCLKTRADKGRRFLGGRRGRVASVPTPWLAGWSV